MYAEPVTVTSDFYDSLGRPAPASWNLPTQLGRSWCPSPGMVPTSPVSSSMGTSGWTLSCSPLCSYPGPPSILSANLQSSAFALLCRGEGQPLCHSPPPGSVFPRPLVCNSLRVPDSVISPHTPAGSPYLTLQVVSFMQSGQVLRT